METIGKRILFLRTRAGLSQEKLADAIGKTKSNISGYENDKFEPSAQTIISLCKLFKVSSDWLLFGEAAEVPISEQSDELSPGDIELLAKFHQLSEKDQGRIEERIDMLLSDRKADDSSKESSRSKNTGRQDAAARQGA